MKLQHLLILFCLLYVKNSFSQSTVLKKEDIYEVAPFPECHASTIVELSKDKMLAAWFGGTRESNPDVCIWQSRLENGRWSTPEKIADGIIDQDLRYPTWNPVLFKTKEGKLFLFYKVGKNPREWWGEMKTSTDDGLTWSKAEKLPEGMLGPIKNKPVQLTNGDILYPTSTESVKGNIWHIHLEKSDKNAKNWEMIPIENDTFGVIQPSILQYADGRMQLLCRSKQNHVVETWSNDGGKTWGPLKPTSLLNPNSGTDAVSLKNGKQVIVYNPLTRGKQWSNGRQKLNVAVSTDGVKWEDIAVLEDETKGEFSYPAIIQASDGLVHITYTNNRKKIKYVVLDVK
ncbi:exo-alpha-sialidase [Emticicia sp. BO119]|uniref:sialidase family protein n=1 Tax=Emticicia sp. BO119 TaxID=2757768 RepID=UPI0015F0A498|nr:sialidase family protein [Emticicia sp. BO119]MBA4852209.1 exo-alpha-sialidase [Emticicia sp. BO119]